MDDRNDCNACEGWGCRECDPYWPGDGEEVAT